VGSSKTFPIVMIVASRGGHEAISEVLRSLPDQLAAAVVVVQHRAELPGSAWADMLARNTGLPVKQITPGDVIEPGVLYLAPATSHIRFAQDGFFHTSDGTRIRGVLSSANPLFESAGQYLGKRAIAVVLTGWGRDGTDGVQAVKGGGGVVIAQDEQSSRDFGMPGSAIATGKVDYVRSIADIGPLILQLVAASQVPAVAR
jgi:two-component system, chemotaxis family, protein-glutamate methylesterase/glutaminase